MGANGEGQLGINNQTAQPTPVAIGGLTTVIAIAAGDASSLALKADGTVWTWGAARQIGDGQNVRRLTPVQVPGLSDVVAIAAGDVADYALKGDGTVWAWGDNTNGQIGDGTGGDRINTAASTPVQAVGLSGVVAIAGGGQHALALVGSRPVCACVGLEFVRTDWRWHHQYAAIYADGGERSFSTFGASTAGAIDHWRHCWTER